MSSHQDGKVIFTDEEGFDIKEGFEPKHLAFIYLDITEATFHTVTVLDLKQVELLRDALTAWLGQNDG